MFDVLVYLYENYWRPDACPEAQQLSRKLSAIGFESEEIADALTWLNGLALNIDSYDITPTPHSIRVYTTTETEVLGSECIGFIQFLESADLLSVPMREMVIDRAMATGTAGLDIHDIKIIVLMVFWCLGQEPDALILDEFFVDPEDRIMH